MDQAGQVPPVLGLHRHHEAAAPHGDNGLLQHPAVGGGGDDPLENLAAFGLGGPHVAADVRQLGAGAVGDDVLLQDGGEDPLLQKPVAPQGAEEEIDGRLLPVVAPVVPHPPGAAQHPGHVQQLPGIQGPAVVRPVQALPHRLDAGEGGGALEADHVPGRVGLVLQALHVFRVRLGDCGQGPLPGCGAVGLIGQHAQDRRKLQRPYGFVK